MNKRTILQKGEPGGDLFVFCHQDPIVVGKAAPKVTTQTVVVERWGEGTKVYRPLVESFGGYDAWIADIATAVGSEGFENVTLITWSAGSQVAKEVCKGEAWPEAIVMLDGLYGDKPQGSRYGDGQVILDEGLDAIARYGCAAARGECTLVITCSRISTPYASSRECMGAVRKRIEEELGAPLDKDATADPRKLGAFVSAVGAGNLHLVEFPGNGPAEHSREGQLYGACWRLWLPWLR